MISVPAIDVDIKYLEHYRLEEWGELQYKKDGDAGIDLRAAILDTMYIPSIPAYCSEYGSHTHTTNPDYNDNESCFLRGPFPILGIPTGICVGLPTGYQIEIRPRSGLSLEKGITVVNSPGTVDSGYTGEIKVILANLGLESFEIEPGERIAQMVLMPSPKIIFNKVQKLQKTKRGSDGFGSTGIKQ